MGKICFDFYQYLYRYNDVSKATIREVSEGLTATFTDVMNKNLLRDITEVELDKAIVSMAKEKAPGHDEFQWNSFKGYDIQ